MFVGEDGRTLYDYADAPRPDADTPAPVRFLPLYDNVYLGYDNRRRMLAEGDAKRDNLLLAQFKPAVLVDGIISAAWSVETGKGAARLVVEPYRKLRKADLRDLEREGLAFLTFMAPDAGGRDVEMLAFAG
jgi:hypothetical protein